MTPRTPGPKIFFGKGIDKLELMCYNVGTTKRKEMINMKVPYIACPECESQLLNPTTEEGMLHFVCKCGVEVWYDGEEEE